MRGDVVNRPVTLVEGLSLEETADRLVEAGLGRREVLLDLMRSPGPIADLDPRAPDLEGYLFPETYSFPKNVDERTVVATLVRTFRARFERQVRPLLAQQPGRSVRQVVTLASIVEKEAKMPAERPLIAGVYSNRLRRGIGLAADPTVIYALKKLGRWDGNIHKADLQVDSPYNTYRYPGAPPPTPPTSPISISSAATTAPTSSPRPSKSTTATSRSGSAATGATSAPASAPRRLFIDSSGPLVYQGRRINSKSAAHPCEGAADGGAPVREEAA